MNEDSYPTRPSLLNRLRDRDDHQSWQEFNDFYSRLVFRFAIKAGCTEIEAEEVVQETLIAVARNLPKFRYQPEICSFKTWLLNLSRWRVQDQLRKRMPLATQSVASGDSSTPTAAVERVPDPQGDQIEGIWNSEWQRVVLEAAVTKVKAQVDPKHWQIFDLHTFQQWSPRDVAKALAVSVGRVYVVKHRIAGLLKKEITRFEQQSGAGT